MVAKKAFNGLRLAVSYPMHNDDPRRLFPHKTPDRGNGQRNTHAPQPPGCRNTHKQVPQETRRLGWNSSETGLFNTNYPEEETMMSMNDPNRLERPPMAEGSSTNFAIWAAAVAVVIALGLLFWPSSTPPTTSVTENRPQVQRDTAATQNVVPPANKPTTTPGTPPPQ